MKALFSRILPLAVTFGLGALLAMNWAGGKYPAMTKHLSKSESSEPCVIAKRTLGIGTPYPVIYVVGYMDNIGTAQKLVEAMHLHPAFGDPKAFPDMYLVCGPNDKQLVWK